jgi:hypothetical protein
MYGIIERKMALDEDSLPASGLHVALTNLAHFCYYLAYVCLI